MSVQQWVAGIIWLSTMTILHCIERSAFHLLWPLYTLAFSAYVLMVFRHPGRSLGFGLVLALIARLVGYYFEPQLSDDYFRFIWDGMLIEAGIHPMAYTPSGLLESASGISPPEGLYSMLNSKEYYSVYPPMLQWIFGLSYLIAGSDIGRNILFLKSIALITDGTIVYLLFRLTKRLKLPANAVLIYALNPLIVLEYTGNLHPDGLMIAGLLGAIMAVEKRQLFLGGWLMALSILSKLLTLILIPFMPLQHYWKRITVFAVIAVLSSMILLWMSFGYHTGWLDSVSLWFTSFEFNASVYYVVRAAGYGIWGYNAIVLLGPAMAICTGCGILLIWWWYLRQDKLAWPLAMLWVMTLYFLMSTTLHPWYLGLVLVLGILSQYTYPVIWTYLVYLSYSHYQGGGFKENYPLIATEYLILMSWMWFELRYKKRAFDWVKGSE